MTINNYQPLISKDELYKMYIIEQKSMIDIAKANNYYHRTISKWLKIYGIPIRTIKEWRETARFKEKIADRHLSEESKKKIGNAQREFQAKHGSPRLGKHFSEETKEKMSKSQIELMSKYKDKCYGKQGYFYSEKSQINLRYRSNYELEAYKILEKDSSVISFKSEPFSIEYEWKGSIHRYLPDILVKSTDGSEKLIEVKAKFYMKYMIDRNKCKFDATKKLCEEKGYSFEIWNEDTLVEKGTMKQYK